MPITVYQLEGRQTLTKLGESSTTELTVITDIGNVKHLLLLVSYNKNTTGTANCTLELSFGYTDLNQLAGTVMFFDVVRIDSTNNVVTMPIIITNDGNYSIPVELFLYADRLQLKVSLDNSSSEATVYIVTDRYRVMT